MKTVKFTQMKDGDDEDYKLLSKFEEKYLKERKFPPKYFVKSHC